MAKKRNIPTETFIATEADSDSEQFIAHESPATYFTARPLAKPGGPSKIVRTILDSATNTNLARPNSTQLIRMIQDGLPATQLFELKSALDVSNDLLAPMAGISKATLNRRRPEERLSAEEGDRIIRYARLMALAVEVMGSPEHARRWLKTPQVALNGSTPLDYALTEIGAREVEDLLGRIEHGVYT